jgi:hypothetical protein
MVNKAQNNKDNDEETIMADEVDGEVGIPSQLYGSSGFLPEAHRHSYDPMVL